MSLSIENDYCQVFDVAAKPASNVFQILLHRCIDVDHTAGRWAHHDLVHVNVRSVEQPAAFGRRQYCNRVVSAQRAKVCAFQRIDRDVDFGTRRRHFFADPKAATDFLANVKHWRFVAFAFADYNPAAHRHRIHDFAHRFNRNLIRVLAIALAHRARRSDGRRFGHAQKIQ